MGFGWATRFTFSLCFGGRSIIGSATTRSVVAVVPISTPITPDKGDPATVPPEGGSGPSLLTLVGEGV